MTHGSFCLTRRSGSGHNSHGGSALRALCRRARQETGRPARTETQVNYDSYQAIKASRRGRILTLALSRPGRMNAVDAVPHEELSRIFYEVAGDDEADVVSSDERRVGKEGVRTCSTRWS